MTTVGLPAAGVENEPVWMPRKVAVIACASRRGGAGRSGAEPWAGSAGGLGRGVAVPGAGVMGSSIGCPSSGQAAHRVIVARWSAPAGPVRSREKCTSTCESTSPVGTNPCPGWSRGA